VVKMQGLGKHRLWTLVSVAPVVVLCGVLFYGYVIRPQLERRESSGSAAEVEVSAHQVTEYRQRLAEIRPDLLDLLTENQRREVEQGLVSLEADFADLPDALRKELTKALQTHPRTAGRRIIGGTIAFYLAPTPLLYFSAERMKERAGLQVRADFNLLGKRGGMMFTDRFPNLGLKPRRRRFQPQPDLMRETARWVVDNGERQVSPEEFGKWWKAAEENIAPLAGGPRYRGRAWTRGPEDLTEAQQAVVRDYLVRVLPRPGLLAALPLGNHRSAPSVRVYGGSQSGRDVLGVYASAAFTIPEGPCPRAHWKYVCPAVGGSLECSWHRAPAYLFVQAKIMRTAQPAG
jgi:hypothetical protein